MINQQEPNAGRQIVSLQLEKYLNCSIKTGVALILDDLLSIDETLYYPMRNRVNFKEFNPNKPTKYGLLFKSINGAIYPYSFVTAPYCGKPKSKSIEEYKQGTFEVKKHMI